MIKGLEAFEKLKNKPTLSADWYKGKMEQRQGKTAYDYNKIEYDIIEKELKELEIIKEHIFYCENVDCFVFVNITKEISDLLKEVLL